jgi:hypothetical protein
MRLSNDPPRTHRTPRRHSSYGPLGARAQQPGLLVAFDWKTNAFIPEVDPDEYRGRGKTALTVEDVARLVREMWMLSKGPIPNMVELLESNGGIVIPCDFGTDLIDALSQRIEGLPTLFFVNVAC